MATFRYKAARPSGEVVEGEMSAESKAELVSRLNESGLITIRAAEASTSSIAGLLGVPVFSGARVSRRQITLATRALATLLKSGIELERALQMAMTLAERPALRRMLENVLAEVRAGRSLADALEPHADRLPLTYVSMVRAGEAGGALEVTFGRLADFLERAEAAREQVRSALIYPVILLVMAIISIIVMVTVVLPQFKPLFDNAGRELPLLTRVFLAMSDAVIDYGWVAAVGLVLAWVVGRRRLSDPETRRVVDGWLLGVPLLGDLIVKLEVSRLARTLGTLLQNGVATLTAIEVAAATLANSAFAHAIRGVAASVRSGRAISDSLAEVRALPPLAARMIGIGEETGRLEEMLLRTADIYEAEAQQTIARLLALLLPALTAVLGLFIALIIGSVFLAIISVNELAL